jgi:hypothetical protein
MRSITGPPSAGTPIPATQFEGAQWRIFRNGQRAGPDLIFAVVAGSGKFSPNLQENLNEDNS